MQKDAGESVRRRAKRTEGFDPEKVERMRAAGVTWVHGHDYDQLLALYRDLKAKEAFHGF